MSEKQRIEGLSSDPLCTTSEVTTFGQTGFVCLVAITQTVLNAIGMVHLVYLSDHLDHDSTQGMYRRSEQWGPMVGGALGCAIAACCMSVCPIAFLWQDQGGRNRDGSPTKVDHCIAVTRIVALTIPFLMSVLLTSWTAAAMGNDRDEFEEAIIDRHCDGRSPHGCEEVTKSLSDTYDGTIVLTAVSAAIGFFAAVAIVLWGITAGLNESKKAGLNERAYERV